MRPSQSHQVFDLLALARQVANHAYGLGAAHAQSSQRPVVDHLGAALADCVLQAGLNYQTVVRGRVERIRRVFPEAATLAGTTQIVAKGAVADFLMWKHPEKIGRFARLVAVMERNRVENVRYLQARLLREDFKAGLLAISGIGPKTVDYLSCLVGIDCVAVDRHIKLFAKSAGVQIDDYQGLKLVVSYAADLLGIRRRDFDSWIWRVVSGNAGAGLQYRLL